MQRKGWEEKKEKNKKGQYVLWLAIEGWIFYFEAALKQTRMI